MKRSFMSTCRGAIILAAMLAVCTSWAKEALITVDAKVRIRSGGSYSYRTTGELEIWQTDEKGKELIKKLATLPLRWSTKHTGGYLIAELKDEKVELPTEGTIIARAIFSGQVAKAGGTFTEDSRPVVLDEKMAADKPKIRFNQLSIKAR